MSSKKEELLKLISDMNSLIELLLEDVNNSNEILGQNLLIAEKTNSYSLINSIIRMRVKLVVSWLESACFTYRNVAREFCELRKNSIPLKYSDLFNRNKKFDSKEKIKLSLKLLSFAFTGDDNIEIDPIEWQEICALIEKRHHITHPNNIDDLKVSEKDLNICNRCMIWFTKQLLLITKNKSIEIPIDISDDDVIKIKNHYKKKYKDLI